MKESCATLPASSRPAMSAAIVFSMALLSAGTFPSSWATPSTYGRSEGSIWAWVWDWRVVEQAAQQRAMMPIAMMPFIWRQALSRSVRAKVHAYHAGAAPRIKAGSHQCRMRIDLHIIFKQPKPGNDNTFARLGLQ